MHVLHFTYVLQNFGIKCEVVLYAKYKNKMKMTQELHIYIYILKKLHKIQHYVYFNLQKFKRADFWPLMTS